MAYHALPNKPASLDSFENADNNLPLPCPGNCSTGRRSKFWRLSIINLVLLILQLLLLLTHITWKWLPRTTNVRGTYGFDTNYMTLAHDYDWLWHERAVQRAGAIALTKNEENVVVEYAVISMYATAFLRLRPSFSVSIDTATRFHQLHCVASLRSALQTAYEGGNVAFDQNEDPHWPHCLHYLHQVHRPSLLPLRVSKVLC
jgi:hypothetical protein